MSSKIGALRLIKQTNKTNTASVIFLHGSGDTGQGVLDWVKFLIEDVAFPHIKLIFPTAPLRPYTPLDGEVSHVWFDRLSITPDVPEHVETLESIGDEMKNLIETQVNEGVPLNRIVIGGFSMGGALALHTAYRFKPGLAGVFALSSFLNDDSTLYEHLEKGNSAGIKTPLYMCHGDHDTMVPLSWGLKTYKKLSELGVEGEFVTIKNAFHELKENEIKGLWQWISKILPEES